MACLIEEALGVEVINTVFAVTRCQLPRSNKWVKWGDIINVWEVNVPNLATEAQVRWDDERLYHSILVDEEFYTKEEIMDFLENTTKQSFSTEMVEAIWELRGDIVYLDVDTDKKLYRVVKFQII